MFYLSEPEPNLNLENSAQVNPNQTWTAKIFWAGAKPEPEPLFETIRHPGYQRVIALLSLREILQNYVFCNVTKLQNAELPIIRSQAN